MHLVIRVRSFRARCADHREQSDYSEKYRMKTIPIPNYLSLPSLAFLLSANLTCALHAEAPAVDPAATQILKRMTDCLGGLQQFSAHTQSTLEDVLDSGHRVDLDVSAKAIVKRPNKIRADRQGDLVDQRFYYNGKTLTLWNPSDAVYATVSAPSTIDETLDYVRESLGLIIPVSDLVYSNSYSLLMQEVTFATIVGKSVINGTKCDHLLFSRPGVDFQIWVADSGKPLPYKLVITDTATPARLSLVTVLGNWDLSPGVTDADFDFTPPEGAEPITFLPVLKTGSSDH